MSIKKDCADKILTRIQLYPCIRDVINNNWRKHIDKNISNSTIPNYMFHVLSSIDDKNCKRLNLYLNKIKATSPKVCYKELQNKFSSKEPIGTLFEVIVLGHMMESITDQSRIKLYQKSSDNKINDCSVKIDRDWINIEVTALKQTDIDGKAENELQQKMDQSKAMIGFVLHPSKRISESDRLKRKIDDKYNQLSQKYRNIMYLLLFDAFPRKEIVDACFSNMPCWTNLHQVYIYRRPEGAEASYRNTMANFTKIENDFFEIFYKTLPINDYVK